MKRLFRVAQIAAVNAVPAVGVFAGGWSAGTALILYWFENLLSTFLILGRISIHRRLTSKRGHYTVVVKTVVSRGRKTVTRSKGTFGGGYALTSLVFTLAHGVFLIPIAFLFLPQQFGDEARMSTDDLAKGLLFTSAILILGFLLDLDGIGKRPFYWVRRMADVSLSRMAVVHLSIIFGMFALAILNKPMGFFAIFMALKLLIDVLSGGGNPDAEMSEEPPRWFVRFVNLVKRDEDARALWREARREELEQQKSDEMPADGKPVAVAATAS